VLGEGRPVARGKGINFNTLLPADHRHVDPVCGAFEICVKVKAYRWRVHNEVRDGHKPRQVRRVLQLRSQVQTGALPAARYDVGKASRL